FAEQIVTVPGFVSKAWLHDGAFRGGFYLFRDRQAARAYVDGPLVAAVRATAEFDDVTARTFEVDPSLSARTGVRGAEAA
ncbi:MAG TPA: YdhR family protein, partial [Pseudonocardia sp.]|nr:YdhR family protein [Pseudonocardia sp.]